MPGDDWGFASFIGSLKSSGNLKLVEDNRMVASAVPITAGVVVAKGLLKGVYVWKIQVPILATYQAARSSVSQNLLVTLLIIRRSVLSHPKGLAVAQFLAEEKRSECIQPGILLPTGPPRLSPTVGLP